MSDRAVSLGLRYATHEQLHEALEAQTGKAWFNQDKLIEALTLNPKDLSLSCGYQGDTVAVAWSWHNYKGDFTMSNMRKADMPDWINQELSYAERHDRARYLAMGHLMSAMHGR